MSTITTAWARSSRFRSVGEGQRGCRPGLYTAVRAASKRPVPTEDPSLQGFRSPRPLPGRTAQGKPQTSADRPRFQTTAHLELTGSPAPFCTANEDRTDGQRGAGRSVPWRIGAQGAHEWVHRRRLDHPTRMPERLDSAHTRRHTLPRSRRAAAGTEATARTVARTETDGAPARRPPASDTRGRGPSESTGCAPARTRTGFTPVPSSHAGRR